MNLNLGATTGAKETTTSFKAGIHKAKFNGVSKEVINGKDGQVYDVMCLSLDIEGFGEFKHNFFEPTSSERKDGMFGKNASPVDHFLISIRQILDAVDPTIGKGIDEGNIVIQGTFSQIINTIKKLTDGHKGVEVQVKLLPNKNNYNDLPAFPARITKDGKLGIATKFIGKEITLTPGELKKIKAAAEAKPTNMANNKSTDDLLAGMNDDLDLGDNDDDLPEL